LVRLVHVPDGDDPAAVTGSHYRIEPAGMRFDAPAHIEIRWDSSSAPGGAKPDEMSLMQRQGTEWVRIAGAVTVAGDVAVRWTPRGPCIGVGSHALDFRVGTWDYRARGYDPGRTVVRRDATGCFVLEQYADATGGHATALFIYTPQDSTWHETSYDPGGRSVMAGRIETDGVAFYHSPTDREVYRSRSDSTAEFSGERSTDGGRTWASWVTAAYTRAQGDAKH
jgi:hypothetical protein